MDRSMSTQVFALAGIEAWPIDFRTPLAWIGLAFGLLLVGGLVWCALASLRRRWTGHFVRCPEDASSAHVFVARTEAGAATDVAVCSRMSPPGHVTCGKECLAQLGRA
jgi:hypothetical protein